MNELERKVKLLRQYVQNGHRCFSQAAKSATVSQLTRDVFEEKAQTYEVVLEWMQELGLGEPEEEESREQ